MNIILITVKKRLNLINLRMDMYPAEGPMLKALVAPNPLMVSCLKSWTIVGAGRLRNVVPRAFTEEEEAPQEGDEKDGEQSRRLSLKT
jgi:hypothetical protein